MNEAMKHIEGQLNELKRLQKKTEKKQAAGVLQGICEAYFRMGKLTQEQWGTVKKRAERYLEWTTKTS